MKTYITINKYRKNKLNLFIFSIKIMIKNDY